MKDFTGKELRIGDEVVFHENFYDQHSLKFGEVVGLYSDGATIRHFRVVGTPVDKETGLRTYYEQEQVDDIKTVRIYKV